MSWDQLAAAVRARRTELGLTQVDVATAGRVSVDTIRNIEHRRRTPKRVNPRTARAIEDALKWEPGSIEDTLAGGEPSPVKMKAARATKPPREQRFRRHPRPIADAPSGTRGGDGADPASTGDKPAAETPTDSSPPSPKQLDGGDRFALARQILALRSALSEHQRAISPEAREALMSEMANSAREAEEAIVRIMPWLDEGERGEAIQLLVKLREPLGENTTGSN
ncbi:helix-turn-helix domain-containing protein [Mycolicibacterium sp. J2]|uniref:helix-turn-helix domain-containing protein n=1 Tax=Mycolicibacterium sp. J2 TaxID=2993511 RepID=UPI00224A4DC9|nr:helix-turn-helix domain-containing protein [Mycolicibacterium sp. J2]MCX2715865.1 helix-turn-helix domain-containing protein [Mycolicibacterium sp. J2]